MPLFQTSGKKLKKMKEQPFRQERDMQKLIESNLQDVFGLEFIASEFAPYGDLRIDTLAYDLEQNSFVIIEYKKGSSKTLVEQGFAYLALLLNNKADFVLKFNEQAKMNMNSKNVNWEASRVIFISPSFSTYQREILSIQDLPFEFWEIRRYNNNIIALNQLQSNTRGAKLSEIKMGTGDAKKVQKELRTYSIDALFEGKKQGKSLYDLFVSEVLEHDPRIVEKALKNYVGLQIDRKNVCVVHPQKQGLLLHFSRFKPKDFNDPEKKVTYLKGSMKHYNTHVSEFRIKEEGDIQYALMLIKQALKIY